MGNGALIQAYSFKATARNRMDCWRQAQPWSDLRDFKNGRMKDFFCAELSCREALFERIARQSFDIPRVLDDAIAPEIFAHELDRILYRRLRPGQRDLCGSHLLHCIDCDLLGLAERFVHGRWQPGILLDEDLSDSDQVHD